MTVSARLNHGVEGACRRTLIELGNGQIVKRSVFFKVGIDHGVVRRFGVKQVVRLERSTLPRMRRIRHDRFERDLKLRIHRDHGRGEDRRAVRLVRRKSRSLRGGGIFLASHQTQKTNNSRHDHGHGFVQRHVNLQS